MLFEAILERNRAFAAGRAAEPLPPPAQIGLAVVACLDPRLDGLLRPALGLEPGRALLIRTPGAGVRPESGALRSLGVAAYLLGLTEVVVVGHTSCRMASFDTATFIDTFRRRGVPREAFGSEDLRIWAGAIPDPKRGVLASVAAVAEAPFLPRDLRVGGLLLDDATGALEVVLRPGEALPAGAAVQPAPEAAAPEKPSAERRAAEDRPAGSQARPPLAAAATSVTAAAPPAAKDAMLEAARSALRSLAATREWSDEIRRLRSELQRTRNPLARLALLEKFIGRAAARSQEVSDTLRRLKREGVGAGSRLGQGGLLELFSRALDEEGP